MIAFKGFSPNLESVLGNGKKETCCFAPGITMEETECKTGRNGFHCCENPFVCLGYYSMNGKNRFWKVEASGNINEDGGGRIACTRITLLEELDAKKLAFYGMKYMIEHPDRAGWQQDRGSVIVAGDCAQAGMEGHIAIARGKDPKVRGPEGSVLGLLVDRGNGIEESKIIIPGEELAGKWLHLAAGRKIEEVQDEKKAG